MNWFYAQNGQQAGPVADEELAHLVQSGIITPGTLVWHSGLASWQPYAAVSATLPAPTGSAVAVGGGAAPAAGGGQAVCSQCGGVFPADEVVRVGDHDVCARCKPVLLQKLQQGVTNAGVFGVQGTRFAGFWIRFAAAILDGLIKWPVSLLLNLAFTFVLKGMNIAAFDPQHPRFDRDILAVFGGYYLLILVLTAAYNGFCLSRFGGMPGMLICGLRAIRPDGQRISFLRGMARYFAAILSSMILGIGYLFIAFDEQKRALHDYICDTRVVYK